MYQPIDWLSTYANYGEQRKICSCQRILALPAIESAEHSQIHPAKIIEAGK